MLKGLLAFLMFLFFLDAQGSGRKRALTLGEKIESISKSQKPAPAEDKEKAYVVSDDIILKKGKGSKKTGGGKGGFFWHILYNNKTAGKIYINYIDEKPIGKHASIQIFLNKQSQGKHIGRFAYKMACEQSSYNEIYAHMRKNNIASRKAAEAAEFVVFSEVSQLIMRWVRK